MLYLIRIEVCMDYDVENLELEIIKTSLSDIDLNVIDKDYDEIESKTKSSNYDTIKPKGLIESLELAFNKIL